VNRKRALLYATLALAVPLPALAIPGGSGAADLGVEASLERCGLAGGSIVCRINASFNQLADAEYYTASVTAANGSVTDLGTVSDGGGTGAASTGVWVPYVGNGTYTVTVSAWGYDERGRPEVVRSEHSGAEGDAKLKRAGEAEAVTAPEAPVEEEPVPVEPTTPVPPEDPPSECPDEADPETQPDATPPEESAAHPTGEGEPVAPPEPGEETPDPCAPPDGEPAPSPVP
jgi:hypothetical protein